MVSSAQTSPIGRPCSNVPGLQHQLLFYCPLSCSSDASFFFFSTPEERIRTKELSSNGRQGGGGKRREQAFLNVIIIIVFPSCSGKITDDLSVFLLVFRFFLNTVLRLNGTLRKSESVSICIVSALFFAVWNRRRARLTHTPVSLFQ